MGLHHPPTLHTDRLWDHRTRGREVTCTSLTQSKYRTGLPSCVRGPGIPRTWVRLVSHSTERRGAASARGAVSGSVLTFPHGTRGELCGPLLLELVYSQRRRDGAGEYDRRLPVLQERGEKRRSNHVPVLVEYEGGHLVHLLLHALQAANVGAREIVLSALTETMSALARMREHLSKFYGTLDAPSFYHVHRPFMAGGKGMEEKGLPRGMVFKMSDGEEKAFKLVGGSAAQSSLFPFLDQVLGIVHQDETMFDEMRSYMPGAHRDFLAQVSHLPSLRTYVSKHASDSELQQAYNECITQLRSWRGKHIAVVSKYIVQPAREAQKAGTAEKLEIDGSDEGKEDCELQGTGGSALIPFLRQAKDDTVGVGS